MKALKVRILKDGRCFEGGILKVDNFINHQMDPILMKSMAVEFVRRFASSKIDKILTVEASGIAPAIMVGYLLELPVVFAKKSPTRNVTGDVYESRVFSFTHGVENHIRVAKQYLPAGSRVLIVDDFLANGEAAEGLCDLCRQAGAEVIGIGVCVEKSFQPGHQKLVEAGYHVKALAKVTGLRMES